MSRRFSDPRLINVRTARSSGKIPRSILVDILFELMQAAIAAETKTNQKEDSCIENN